MSSQLFPLQVYGENGKMEKFFMPATVSKTNPYPLKKQVLYLGTRGYWSALDPRQRLSNVCHKGLKKETGSLTQPVYPRQFQYKV
jgi:hypothetical protein